MKCVICCTGRKSTRIPRRLSGRRAACTDLRGGDHRRQIAAKRGRVKALPEGLHKAATAKWERRKTHSRLHVEHPFHIIKNLFSYRKVRYRGLAKNLAQLHSLFTLATCLSSAADWPRPEYLPRARQLANTTILPSVPWPSGISF